MRQAKKFIEQKTQTQIQTQTQTHDIVFIPPSKHLDFDKLERELLRENIQSKINKTILLVSKCGCFEIIKDKIYDTTPIIHTHAKSIVECGNLKFFRQQMNHKHILVSYVPPDFCQYTKEVQQFFYKKNSLILTLEKYSSDDDIFQKVFFTVKNNNIDVKEMSKYLTLFC